MEVAKAAANELYERQMGDNYFYQLWKKQNPNATDKQLRERFVERNWPRCIEFARQTMTVLLTKDDVSIETKDKIMEALEKDFSLRNKTVGRAHHGVV